MNGVQIYAAGGVVAIALVALFFAPFLGLPVGISPSTGGSMGDPGPVLNVWIDTEPEVGDVVVFDTKTDRFSHQQAAHRTIDETDKGFVTQGDANTFVDQDRGAAYVTDETILGTVLIRVSVYKLLSLGPIATVTTIGLLQHNKNKLV